MHLVIDIGNTNIVFGVYDATWIKTIRVPTADISAQSLKNIYNQYLEIFRQVSRVTVSSVVPRLNVEVVDSLHHFFSCTPYLIQPDIYDRLDLEILNPNEIGTDLVANAVAALEKIKGDCVIVDFGTALTFSIILDSKIIGVNILPGIKTSLNALIGNAAQLPEIPLVLTDSVIGTDTQTAIQSGILWGYVGLVEKMLERIEQEVGTPLKRIATGGLSLILPPLKDQFYLIDQQLTLEGIRLIGEVYHANIKK